MFKASAENRAALFKLAGPAAGRDKAPPSPRKAENMLAADGIASMTAGRFDRMTGLWADDPEGRQPVQSAQYLTLRGVKRAAYATA